MTATSPSSRPSVLRRLVRFGFKSLLVIALLLGLRVMYAFRDRQPGGIADLDAAPDVTARPPKPVRVGFARHKINPDMTNPKEPVWLAGFSQHRAATGIHDDLWAVATVIDDGRNRLALVVLDAIGFFNDDVVEVRKRLPASLGITYAIVCSTHNHSTPDLMGLWGPHPLKSGVNPKYREHVIQRAALAIEEAAQALQPAEYSVHEVPLSPEGLVADTRKPKVFDADLRLLLFRSTTNQAILGSIVGWGNHPETVWSGNTEITADFPGYLRDGLEKGIPAGAGKQLAGLGGIHVFVNGAVGGLMTTHPSVTVKDPYEVLEYSKPSHEKTRALGQTLAKHLLTRLQTTNAVWNTTAPLAIRSRVIHVPLDNVGFLIAPVLGILDRGHDRRNHMRTEVGLVTFGEISMASIPGEIYPELVNGGVEKAPGADFGIDPLEVPPIRELMPGKTKFILGLANDEIGYIIPKSEWDRKPPYLYGAEKAPYGEVNSVGPEAAGMIHRTLKALCQKP